MVLVDRSAFQPQGAQERKSTAPTACWTILSLDSWPSSWLNPCERGIAINAADPEATVPIQAQAASGIEVWTTFAIELAV